MPRLLAPIPPDRRGRRFAQLLVGLVLYGTTAAMMVLAGLGLDPWDVFHQGLSRTFGLGIGTWAIIASFAVLLCWVPLRQRPGIGTVLNALIVGLVIDLVLSVFTAPHVLWARIALLIGGVVGNAIATGFYIGAGLGPGPRDGLSTGIAGRGHSMRVVRTSIEASVLVSGFLLGGAVGIGTVCYAVAIGPITHVTIPLLAIDRRRSSASAEKLVSSQPAEVRRQGEHSDRNRAPTDEPRGDEVGARGQRHRQRDVHQRVQYEEAADQRA
jgi:uncharacterized membrane protein YczE